MKALITTACAVCFLFILLEVLYYPNTMCGVIMAQFRDQAEESIWLKMGGWYDKEHGEYNYIVPLDKKEFKFDGAWLPDPAEIGPVKPQALKNLRYGGHYPGCYTKIKQ